jgi:ribosome biogenesis protein NSA1
MRDSTPSSYPLPLTHDPSSEVFVSDQTTNLFAVDMCSGRVVYGYEGKFPSSPPVLYFQRHSFLPGIVGVIALSPAGLISTSLDRYAHMRSTYLPPLEAGQPQDEKGTVLEKVYMKSTPTCVVRDGLIEEVVDKDDD